MRTGEEGDPLASPPAPLRQTSANTIELRQGGGCITVLGLLFFLTGIFLAGTAIRVLSVQVEPDHPAMRATVVLMSVLFLGLGAAFVFGRQWLILDLSTRSLTRSYGLIVPIRSEQRPLSDFTAVVIAYDRGDSDSPEQYPVRLRAMIGKDFAISKPGQFSTARKQAEYLSLFLRLPLADTTTDREAIVTPERTRDSLRERLVPSDLEAGRVPRPLTMRSEVEEWQGYAKIVIRGRASLLTPFVVVIPAVLFLVVIPFLLQIFSRNETPVGVRMFFLTVIVALFGIPSIIGSVNAMVGRKRKGTTVEASPAGLVITRRSAWRTRSTTVSAPDILDLDYGTFEGELDRAIQSTATPAAVSIGATRMFAFLKKLVPNRGMVVKTRSELITLGEGLPADELRYLTFVLRKALAGR